MLINEDSERDSPGAALLPEIRSGSALIDGNVIGHLIAHALHKGTGFPLVLRWDGEKEEKSITDEWSDCKEESEREQTDYKNNQNKENVEKWREFGSLESNSPSHQAKRFDWERCFLPKKKSLFNLSIYEYIMRWEQKKKKTHLVRDADKHSFRVVFRHLTQMGNRSPARRTPTHHTCNITHEHTFFI